MALLEAVPRRIFDVAPEMAVAANSAKGISPKSTWAAEEWATNIWVSIHAINTQLHVLRRLLAGKEPLDAGAVHTRLDGQVDVDIFPLTVYDHLLFHRYRATVWIEPEST